MLPVHDKSDARNVKSHTERAGGDDRIDGRENPAVKPPLKVVTARRIASVGMEELQTPRNLEDAHPATTMPAHAPQLVA